MLSGKIKKPWISRALMGYKGFADYRKNSGSRRAAQLALSIAIPLRIPSASKYLACFGHFFTQLKQRCHLDTSVMWLGSAGSMMPTGQFLTQMPHLMQASVVLGAAVLGAVPLAL